jgi:hypothetical protein
MVAGLPPGVSADGAARVPEGPTCEPRREHRDRYEAMHEQFVAAFDALLPVHRALHAWGPDATPA